MSWLLLRLLAQRALCTHYIRHTVMVIGLKALMGTRHPLVAGSHELTGVLLPGVEGVPLFLVG